jgi:hypothetical protein
MSRGGRGLRALLVALVCAAAVGAGPAAHADPAAQGCSARAVVVVEPGPGAVSICFTGSISGLDALQLAGANPVTYGFSGQGAAVCQLYGVGNPADQSCLVGPGGQYWAYYRAAPGAGGWTYSRGGASSTTVVDGSVEGWKYGTGGAPGFVAFCSVVSCAPPPTDPPATAPPPAAPAAPAVTPAGPAASPAGGGTTAPAVPPGATAGTPPSSTKEGKGGKAANGAASAGDAAGKTGEATSTSEGKHRADGATSQPRRARRASDDVALGGGSGGGDSGSPLGVLVAVAVVVLGAGTGLWIRRRRRGPTPG